MRRALFALAIAFMPHAARAAPHVLTWGLDTALTPANVCLQYTSTSCFSIGTMTAAGQYVLPATMGGTGLITGAQGSILYWSSPTVISATLALTNNALVIGGGAGAAPSTIGSTGTTTTLLHGNAAGPPTFAAVNLGTEVTGTLLAGSFATGPGVITPVMLANQAAATMLANATNASAAPTAVLVPFSAPQGRLTLTTATPVMTSSVTGATTVFYTPGNQGNQVPLPNANGGAYIMTAFAEVSQLTTDTTKSPAAVAASSCYDIFVWSDAGTIRATRGPVWTNCTTRSAGTVLVINNGILVNSVAITNGPGTGLGVWVGSIGSNSGSTIDYIFGASASGGTAGVLNVCNAYNRNMTSTAVIDSGASYTYALTTIRQARASAGNQITFMACSTEEPVLVSYMTEVITVATASFGAFSGVGLDSTTTFGLPRFETFTTAAVAMRGGQTTTGFWNSGLGKHVVSANEATDGAATNTYDNASTATLSLTIRN